MKFEHRITHDTHFARFDLSSTKSALLQVAEAVQELMGSAGVYLVYGITFSSDVQEKIKTSAFHSDLATALQIADAGFELGGMDVEFENENVKLKLPSDSFVLYATNKDNN